MFYKLFTGTNQWVAYFISACILVLVSLLSSLLGIGSENNNLLLPTIYFVLILSGTITLNELLIKHKLVGVNNYLPQFIAIIFMINAPWSENHLRILISSIISCIAIYRTLGLYNKPKMFVVCFEIGLLFGLSTIITHSFWTSVFLGAFGISWVKSTSVRDYLAYSTGFLYVIGIYFLIGYLIDYDFINPFLETFEFNIPKLNALSSYGQAAFVFVSLISVYLVFKGISRWDKQNVKTRIHYRIWLVYLLLLGPSLTFYFPKNPLENSFLFLGFPIAVLSMETINSLKKKYWVNIIGGLLILSSIAMRYI
jgi:hypothetical protein